MSPQTELARRWQKFQELDVDYERDLKEQRWKELGVLRYDEAYAYVRIQVEAFCRHRIFLPLAGLTLLRPMLERHGFYFEPFDNTLVKTLFPDGWSLMPSGDYGKDQTQAWFAILVSPVDEHVAKVYYEAKKSGVGATISPLFTSE